MSRTAKTRDRAGIYKDQIYALITIYKTGISFYNSSLTVLDKKYKFILYLVHGTKGQGFLKAV